MKEFLKNTIGGLFLIGDSPKRNREGILSNVKFAFPFPMYFMWTGIATHLMLHFKLMNKNISDSPLLLLLFWLSFTLTAYPFF
jgi:hypothetical protein